MKVTLVEYIRDAEKILTAGGLATRSHKTLAEYEPTEKEIKMMIKLSKEMKLSSILDFPYYIFTIKDVSRSFTHQWVRYRMAAHMQQSLRYVKVDPNNYNWFVIPPKILQKDVNVILEYVRTQINSGKSYLKMLESGIPPEDARFLLPIGVKTHISTAMDAEELLHIIYQRTCYDAQWEIRTVAFVLLLAGYIVHPLIFQGAGPSCISENICRGTFKGKCYKDVKKLIDSLFQLGDKYRIKYNNLSEGSLEIDLTDILGYRMNINKKKELTSILGKDVDFDFKVVLEVRK